MKDAAITLHVRNLGHVPSFKNGKMLFLTNNKNREWMKRCTASFVFQLLSACQTEGDATLMVPLLRSLIASLPQDDNWKIISEIQIKAVGTIGGDEGATITIDKIA